MSSGARVTWRAKPCGWRDRERVVALGEEFGPAGPLMLDLLEELAKEQRGPVRAGLRSLARGAFLERGEAGTDHARRILIFAAKLGALDELEIAEDVAMTVTCRVSGFSEDQGAGYESVKRAMTRASTCPENRDTVPSLPPTGQDRTEQNRTKNPSKTEAELFAFWQEATRHPQAKLTDERRRKIRQRLDEGYTVEQIRQAIRGAAVGAFVDERGKRYDDLELICRNGTKLESFIDRADAKPVSPMADRLTEQARRLAEQGV